MILKNVKDEYEIEINKIDAILNKIVEPIIHSFKEDFLKDIVANEHKRYIISRSSDENEIKKDIERLVSHTYYSLKNHLESHHRMFGDFKMKISIFYSNNDNSSIHYSENSLVILSEYSYIFYNETEGENEIEFKKCFYDLYLCDENYHTLKNKDKVKTFTIK